MVGLKEGNERLTADPIFFFQEEDQLMVNLMDHTKTHLKKRKEKRNGESKGVTIRL